MSKVGSKGRNGETGRRLLQKYERDGGLDLGGGGGDERRALRHDLGHSLVAAMRDLADRMDVRGEGEGGREDNSKPGHCSALYVI